MLLGCFGNTSKSNRINDMFYFDIEDGYLAVSEKDNIVIHNDTIVAIEGYIVPKKDNLTEFLISVYENGGVSSIEKLNGSFVIVVIDKGILRIIRDVAGAKSLFYNNNNGLYFSTRARTLLNITNTSPLIEPNSVMQYFSFSFLPEKETMIKNVFSLSASTTLTYKINDNNVCLNNYSKFIYNEKEEKSDSDWKDEFGKIFEQAVSERLPQDNRPVALFLSGGIDSSAVAWQVNKLYSGNIHTFSIHFGEEYPNELEYSRLMANVLDSEHYEVFVRPEDFFLRLDEIINYLDEPLGDPISVPNYELARYAAAVSDVVFNGEGGDPVF